ncbi:MAG: hypothetical protein FD170_3577 [Bacteroidetes bacterium]|nr:MAG: hypothetical protein FD170_3577 [Bacteroidota bacterium]
MRILIYSDVHGNLPAFETVLKDAGPCDSYICLGDLVNYGPWSNECVDLAMSLPNSTILMGNHEEAFISGFYSGSNTLVQDFFRQTLLNFDRFQQIKSFLPSYKVEEYLCIHTVHNQNIYPDTIIELDKNYIIGHSHHQFLIKNNGFNLYNAGSVGQNRKIINIASYLIFDTDLNKIEMNLTKFDINLVIDKMKDLLYPQNCILYYKQKQKF